jgi:hypothetical protein
MKAFYLFRLIVLLVAALACAGAATAASVRHTIVISDLHVGAGKDAQGQWKPSEDFRWQDDFDAFLAGVSRRSGDQADLILAGDVFELWQSPTMVCATALDKASCAIADCSDANSDLGCSEAEALARLRTILAQHPRFLASLIQFAQRGSNTVHLVPGNHDAALLFPALQNEFRSRVGGKRVILEDKGYWLSADGAIYSDHGHIADHVNRFGGWPRPFVQRGGASFLVKPWGENMVQRFYNQYEAVFPIIDNLGSELTGMSYAVRQAGFPNTAVAIRKFFRVYLFEQSLRQAATSLDPPAEPRYDRDAVRALPIGFFVEAAADGLSPQVAAEITPGPADGFSASLLSDEEIDALCAAKEIREQNLCPSDTATLSGLVAGIISSDDARTAAHLKATLGQVATQPGKIASVYIFGHTHKARMPSELGLGAIGTTTANVVQVNTGAFQRLGSEAQIKAILRTKPVGATPLSLQPEDLPACYNYVWVPPYAAGKSPGPSLLYWSKRADGRFDSGEGACLQR